MSVWHTFLQYYDSSVNDVGSLVVGVWFGSYLVFALRKAFFQTHHGGRFYVVLALSLVGLITSTAIPMTLILWLWPTRPMRRWRRDHKPLKPVRDSTGPLPRRSSQGSDTGQPRWSDWDSDTRRPRWSDWGSEQPVKCSVCNGRKTEPCLSSLCHGGLVDTGEEGNARFVPCRVCWGKGVVNCRTCGGRGTQ